MGASPLPRPGLQWFARAGVRLGAACAVIVVLGAMYWLGIRPRQLHWGATAAELEMALPEDGIVAHPVFDATRAITIAAPPEAIWPWLAQMGYGRAGFYGYDLIENPGGGRGLRSATSILPQFQQPQTGDVLPLSVAAILQFGTVEPNRVLVWRSRDDPHTGVYIWALVPVDAGHTRLVSRIRWRYLPGPVDRALGVFTEFADPIAVRAILRGVRDRAEGRRPGSLAMQGAEIGGWVLATLELLAAAGMIVGSRRPAVWAFRAAITGSILMFVLYAGAPPWFNAVVPCAWLAAMVAILGAGRKPAPMRGASLTAG